MNNAMYKDFGTVDNLLLYIDDIIKKLPDESKAKKLAVTLKEERNKLCRTCKGEYFTISKGGHSRGEGIMGTIKGNGKLKDLVKSWNLYQLVTHYINLNCNKDSEKSVVIQKLIQENRCWSKFVQEKWTIENEKSSEYTCYQRSDNTNMSTENVSTYFVRHQSKSIACNHEVTIHKCGLVEYSCRDFKSTKIPCRHICLVKTSQAGMSLFSVETLHQYWHLKNHPLYDGVVGNIIHDSSSIKNNPSNSRITIDQYQKIIFPYNRRIRYTNLESTFDKLSDIVNDCPHLYKKTLLQLNNMLIAAKCESTKKEQSHEENKVIRTQPPICKKAYRRIDVNNISSASLMKINVPKKCTICQARGIKSPHGHRKSSKCPFYKKYCLICLKIGEVTNLHDTDKCPNNSTTTLDENEKLANSIKNSHSNFYNILFEIFKVINMKPNGHCGLNAIMKVIPLEYGSFHNVVKFRKLIYHSFDKFKSNCFKIMSFKSVN